MLNKFFSHVYVINLPRRADRRLSFFSNSKKHLTSFILVDGVDGNNIDFKNPDSLPHFSAGDVGCVLSHLNVVTAAKSLKNPFYLVLEDDVKFHKNFEIFPEFWKEVPENWDLVYFGANHNGTNPPNITDKVVRVNGSFTTHAMAIKSTMYDALIEVWGNPRAQVDVLLSSLHSKFNCYCFTPNLAGQQSGYSDIQNSEVNYDFLLKD
jgi:glycosyl transferase family 25